MLWLALQLRGDSGALLIEQQGGKVVEQAAPVPGEGPCITLCAA